MASGDNNNDQTKDYGSDYLASAEPFHTLTGIHPGAILKDRYVIEKELGRGGIGVVYLARDRQLHSRPVVIKVLLAEVDENAWINKKFRTEIEALARLNHPNIVAALDAGELPSGKPYLVMQYAEGVDLRSLIGPDGMDTGKAARILRQIGVALTVAHDKGIIHCDLKPENVIVQQLDESEELVRILDFGIARVRDSKIATQHNTTRIIGTVAYMAPEQLEGKPTFSSDIYAAGVIAYEMLTGVRPFNPVTQFQILDAQRQGVEKKPRELRPELPEAAQAEILKALSFKADDRQRRARDFTDALARALTGATDGAASRFVEQKATDRIVPQETGQVSPNPTQQLTLEMAHVLFVDLVGYSTLPMDRQAQRLQKLNETVRNTAEFRRMQENDQLLRLPTGDGMALVFFRDPMAPVQCALEIARAVKAHPEIKLRMGAHTGPVYQVADINANRNVAGGGINVAQRVMECGDAGHILLSQNIAEVLGELSNWSTHLRDLGEVEVKHGLQVHLFNLYTGELGNPDPPRKLSAAKEAVTPAKETGEGQGKVQKPPKRSLAPWLVAATVLMALAVIAAILWPKPEPAPPVPPSPPVAERLLNYHFTVQEYDPNGQPIGQPFRDTGRSIFRHQFRLRLTVGSPQPGYLYIVNEGPLPTGGSSYNVLFPKTTFRNGSARLEENQPTEIPANIVFDESEGIENFWLIWSAEPVAEMEQAKRWANPTDRGMMKDADQVEIVRQFLAQQATNRPEKKEDGARQEVSLKGRGDLLVTLIPLQHR